MLLCFCSHPTITHCDICLSNPVVRIAPYPCAPSEFPLQITHKININSIINHYATVAV